MLGGSGLLWQDGETCRVQAGDTIAHAANMQTHTLRAGDDGLDVLAFGTRVPIELCHLPRAGYAWAGPTVVESPGLRNLFRLDDAAGEFAFPEPGERFANVAALDDVEPDPGPTRARAPRPRQRRRLAPHRAEAGRLRAEPAGVRAPLPLGRRGAVRGACRARAPARWATSSTRCAREVCWPARRAPASPTPCGRDRRRSGARLRHPRAERHLLLPALRQGLPFGGGRARADRARRLLGWRRVGTETPRSVERARQLAGGTAAPAGGPGRGRRTRPPSAGAGGRARRRRRRGSPPAAAAGRARRRRRRSPPAPGRPRRRRPARAAPAPPARRRDRGSSSSARRSDASSPSSTSRSASLGSSPRRNELHRLPRHGAGELVDHAAVPERLHRRDALHPVARRESRVGVDVHLDQLDLAAERVDRRLQHRRQLAAGAAPVGPEVDHHRQLLRAVDDVAASNGGVGRVDRRSSRSVPSPCSRR